MYEFRLEVLSRQQCALSYRRLAVYFPLMTKQLNIITTRVWEMGSEKCQWDSNSDQFCQQSIINRSTWGSFISRHRLQTEGTRSFYCYFL